MAGAVFSSDISCTLPNHGQPRTLAERSGWRRGTASGYFQMPHAYQMCTRSQEVALPATSRCHTRIKYSPPDLKKPHCRENGADAAFHCWPGSQSPAQVSRCCLDLPPATCPRATWQRQSFGRSLPTGVACLVSASSCELLICQASRALCLASQAGDPRCVEQLVIHDGHLAHGRPNALDDRHGPSWAQRWTCDTDTWRSWRSRRSICQSLPVRWQQCFVRRAVVSASKLPWCRCGHT